MEKEVLTIENSVVTKCDENAVDVVIPEGVTEIGGSAFSDCKSLSSVVIPASVTEIGNSAFRGCESLLSVVIPDGVTEIGESAFRNCYKLESIVIPPEVKKIGERAFYCCESLKSVVISSPETKITAGAFGSCDSVSEIVFGGTKQQWKVVDKGFNLWEKEKLEFIKCSDGECRKRICAMEDGCLQRCLDFNVRKITIGDDVTKIGRYAFTSCDFLESVVIEEGVKEIENRAFFFQESLKSVKIPSTITKIGINAFRGCSAVEKIESDSPLFPFDEKTGKLYDVTGKRRKPLLVLAKIIAKQKKIAELQRISANSVIQTLGKKYKPMVSGYRIDKIAFLCINVGKSGMQVMLQDCDVEKWSPNFLPLLDFAKTCTDSASLRKYAAENGFTDASRKFLYSRNGGVRVRKNTTPIHIALPCGTTKIRKNAFKTCDSLKSVVIPSGVTEIGENAFFDCVPLQSVFIPQSVTKIGRNTFNGCINLSEITFGGTIEEWKALTNRKKKLLLYAPAKSVHCSDGECEKPVSLVIGFGNKKPVGVSLGLGVTKISEDAFSGDESISTVVIPDGITEIGSRAFKNCGIQTVVLPSSLEKIGDSAFEGCKNLSIVLLPLGLKRIGARAFFGCESLSKFMYSGNMSQFRNVEKGADWGKGVKAETIKCEGVDRYALTIENDVVTSCDKNAISVVIPAGVKKIGRNSFKDCYSLEYVGFQQSVTEIAENAFDDCVSLETIAFVGTTAEWKAIKKSDDWNKNLPADCVHCADGEVAL